VTDIQMLPSNVNAEMAVIGSCFTTGMRSRHRAVPDSRPLSDLEQHRWIYDAILRCYQQRTPTGLSDGR
jgi:replicative DNA helicase